MSWHYSLALVEEYSGDIFLGGDAFAQSNASHSNVVFSCSDRMMAFCQRSPSGMMCEHLTDEDGEALLMLFLVASRAKTSAPQAEPEGKDWMEAKADYGLKCTGSFMKYDPATHSLRTHQLSLFGGWIECSRTLPRYGLMLDGECFQQRMLEHGTDVSGYGSQGSIGTPIKSRSYRSDSFRSGAMSPYEQCRDEGGVPKIEWLEHLMGWPIGWTDLAQLEMAKFQQWLYLHGEL